jgi:hypothetical protein
MSAKTLARTPGNDAGQDAGKDAGKGARKHDTERAAAGPGAGGRRHAAGDEDMPHRVNRLVTDRRDLRRVRWQSVEGGVLPDGAVRARIDAFALTANNITYAAFGEAMNYWAFFPTGDAATGLVPVWGFATVVESRCAALPEGERLYGYWPIASHATLQPAQVRAAGFVDATAHRAALPAVYNRYRRCAADPGYDAAREAEQALLQPLFATAFLIDDFLHEHGFFGAHQVLLSSASSKTACATAFCLARRGGEVARVGLTSPAHLGFTRGLGCYTDTLAYEAIGALDAAVPSVYVDFNGSAEVRAAVHGRFGDRLVHSSAVGTTDWSRFGPSKGLPGPKPVFFFAPARIDKRTADWGAAALNARIAESWQAFVQRVSDPAQPWLRVVHGHGEQAIAEAYTALAEGRADPHEGHLLHFA